MKRIQRGILVDFVRLPSNRPFIILLMSLTGFINEIKFRLKSYLYHFSPKYFLFATIQFRLPPTSFQCDGLVNGGLYADTSAQCQMYHMCARGKLRQTCWFNKHVHNLVFRCFWYGQALFFVSQWNTIQPGRLLGHKTTNFPQILNYFPQRSGS